MSTELTQSHFELFALPERYAVDRAALDSRYRELQRGVHPDRFASASDQARRISMQQAAQINEAYQTLRDPLKRARYLLALRGHAIDDQKTTAGDPAFLMQQMELREEMGELRQATDPLAALDGLLARVRASIGELEGELEAALDGGDYENALELVLKMQFYARLESELQELEAELEDELY